MGSAARSRSEITRSKRRLLGFLNRRRSRSVAVAVESALCFVVSAIAGTLPAHLPRLCVPAVASHRVAFGVDLLSLRLCDGSQRRDARNNKQTNKQTNKQRFIAKKQTNKTSRTQTNKRTNKQTNKTNKSGHKRVRRANARTNSLNNAQTNKAPNQQTNKQTNKSINS